MKLLIHSNSHLIIPSKVSCDRFVAHFTPKVGKLSVIPFGPLEIFKEYAKAEVTPLDNLILYYGNISEYKGIDVLIEAMKKVVGINPGLQLIIAGGGEFLYDISSLGTHVQVINRHVSNAEIAELNQRATLVVCPYTSASQSGVVMTTFAFGKPVVATNVGALPEFVEDKVTGIIIEPSDADMLADAIIKLFEDPETLKGLAANVVSKYHNSENSWLNIAKRTHELYQTEIERKYAVSINWS